MTKDTSDDPVYRRFGRDWDKPCNRRDVLTCALWQCQKADKCQFKEKTTSGGGA